MLASDQLRVVPSRQSTFDWIQVPNVLTPAPSAPRDRDYIGGADCPNSGSNTQELQIAGLNPPRWRSARWAVSEPDWMNPLVNAQMQGRIGFDLSGPQTLRIRCSMLAARAR